VHEYSGRELKALLGLPFDPDSVRRTYAEEREKRLHRGDRRYSRMSGDFARYFADPAGRQPRVLAPVTEDVDVVVVGAGFGGLVVAARLREQGIKRLRIIERGADVGGNWYWNQYPNAACDTEAYCYLPLLEETGYMPSRRYIDAGEIQEHAQRIARHFSLLSDTLLATEVVGLLWDEGASRWEVRTDHDDVVKAQFLVIAGGETVGSPKLPGIPGMETFAGPAFHTARWDYGVTGGDVRGDLVKLADKRVGLIGTGASAVQVVAPLGRSAARLYVFQRTPAQVIPRKNTSTDQAWWHALAPGWQRQRMIDFIAAVEGGGVPSEPLKDCGFADQAVELAQLTGIIAASAANAGVVLDPTEILELANMSYMERVRNTIDVVVKDPATAEALKPKYAFGCKRPCWDDHFLETFNRPNVSLVDTVGAGVERITEKAIVANGIEYDVDVIVYASGYQAGNSRLFQLTRFPVVGRGGITLEEHWSDAYRTLHGVQVHHFPNYFQMSIIGNGLGANFLHANGEQARHIAWIINRCKADGVVAVEPRRAAEDDWRAVLDHSQSEAGGGFLAEFRRRFLADCTPGQYNNEGDSGDRKGVFANIYGGGSLGYIEILEQWRTAGDMAGLDLRF